MHQLPNLIDGRSAPPRSNRWLDVVEPATGDVYARVADSDGADVGEAVAAARRAFPEWSGRTARQRSETLLRIAELIETDLEKFAQAESMDTGKPIALARTVDIPRAVANFRFFATAILHQQSEAHITDHEAINYTLRRPRGVAGLIAPWNLPLYLLTWKIAPAIAAGNTCVAKPSEVTPMTAHMLGDAFARAQTPPGVVNIVHGAGKACGGAIVEHPDVPAISFTGSTGVGRWIAQTAGGMLKRVSLELGGKNPFLIFDDADLGAVADAATRAAFSNQGQICLCGSRILVQRPLHESFVRALVERARAIRIGDPHDPATQHGALVSAAHLQKVESYVRLARDLGGKIHCGGERVTPGDLPERCRAGFFFPPTVITDLPHDCRVLQEEIFGPVVTVSPFDTDDEGLALANDTPYGLAAVVWTRSLARAHRAADLIQAGIVWVNCWMLRDLRTPFGGMKDSGVGREGGVEALRFFTEPKNVCVKL